MTYLHAHIPPRAAPPKFGAGERVIIVPHPYDDWIKSPYAVGETGTVKYTGPCDHGPVVVLLDSTGRDAHIAEDRLAPEPDTP